MTVAQTRVVESEPRNCGRRLLARVVTTTLARVCARVYMRVCVHKVNLARERWQAANSHTHTNTDNPTRLRVLECESTRLHEVRMCTCTRASVFWLCWTVVRTRSHRRTCVCVCADVYASATVREASHFLQGTGIRMQPCSRAHPRTRSDYVHLRGTGAH